MISLNFRDSRPIYEQLCQCLQQMILSGAIAPEERLPSARELSAELAINPNTIMRAYRELESAGYIYTIPGKGSFAAPLDEVHDDTKMRLLAQLCTSARALLQLGLTAPELAAAIEEEANKLD